MTIMCVASARIPGVWPCSHLGQHKITCPDDPRNGSSGPKLCRGCLPRLAQRGFLCQWHYERVVAAYEAWNPFKRRLAEAEGRAVSPEGGGATPEGYVNLPLSFLAVDECFSYLKSMAGKTLDVWVHDEAGARDALRFACAAEAAYRSLEVEEHPKRIERVRCPHCGFLSLHENPTREVRGKVVIECQHCWHVLDEIRMPSTSRWVGSESCEHDDHLGCAGFRCRCACHELGRSIDAQYRGVEALWNADLHATDPAYAPRDEWVFEDGAVRQMTAEERRTA